MTEQKNDQVQAVYLVSLTGPIRFLASKMAKGLKIPGMENWFQFEVYKDETLSVYFVPESSILCIVPVSPEKADELLLMRESLIEVPGLKVPGMKVPGGRSH
jgi:hypothetical protein